MTKKTVNLRNIVDVKLVSNEKDYSKQKSRPNSMPQKYLTMITLAPNKLVYVVAGMFLVDLNKVLMYEFNYD